MRFSEHGAAVDAGGRLAAWGGIGLYRWNGRKLLENFVEQDFLAQEAQLATGDCAPLESPHLDPWVSTRAEPANPDAEAVVRRWLEKGDLRDAANVVIDGSWYEGPDGVADRGPDGRDRRPVLGRSARGLPRAASEGATAADSPASTLASSAARRRFAVSASRACRAGEVRDVRAITDRLGARRELLARAI